MIEHGIFNDREEAGWMLVERLRGTTMQTPLVLAIPRGGVEIGRCGRRPRSRGGR